LFCSGERDVTATNDEAIGHQRAVTRIRKVTNRLQKNPQLSPSAELASRAAVSRRALVFAALLVAFLPASVGAQSAPDFEAYAAMVERAEEAHRALEGQTGDSLRVRQEYAVLNDFEAIQWLDEFLGSQAFGSLPQESRELVFRDRYRLEFNASTLLVELDRCEEARERVRSLLDSGTNDPDLRPHLMATYDQAVACATQVRLATLVVNAEPSDAELIIDGQFVGLADTEHEVELGQHTLLVRQTGFLSEEVRFAANSAGERVEIGPITLVSEPTPPPAETGLAWYEWTLVSTGVAALGTGIGYLIWSGSRQSDLDLLEEQGATIVDPEREESVISDLRLVGIIGVSTGVAAISAGLISYLMRGDDVSDDVVFEISPTRIQLSVAF